MITQVFENYTTFRNRKDKNINGVDKDFAKEHPDYPADNKTNKGCWNCEECSDCKDCISCRECTDCTGCKECVDSSDCNRCKTCIGCTSCLRCEECSDCDNCAFCLYTQDSVNCLSCSQCESCRDSANCNFCFDCSDYYNGCDLAREVGSFVIPKLINIHGKVKSIIKEDGNSLNTTRWHKCESAHCRAGWVIHLTGKEGAKLEAKTSTPFSAYQIYKKSSLDIPVSFCDFYAKLKESKRLIESCARIENGADK